MHNQYLLFVGQYRQYKWKAKSFEKCSLICLFHYKLVSFSLKSMLERKIAKYIEDHITSDSDKILIIEGARQI